MSTMGSPLGLPEATGAQKKSPFIESALARGFLGHLAAADWCNCQYFEGADAGEGSPAKWASEAAAWAAREAGVEAPPPADDGEDWAPRSSPLGKSLSKAAREAAMEIG